MNLIQAVVASDYNLVEKLLKDPKLKVNGVDSEGATALIHAAVMATNDKTMESIELKIFSSLLLNPKIDVNASNDNRITPLTIASFNGNRILVEKLLAHPGIQVNLSNANGDTALHLAVQKNWTKIVDLLLKHPKIDPNLKNEQRLTPLMMASSSHYLPILDSLIGHPLIDVNRHTGDEKTLTALHIVSILGFDDVVTKLLAVPTVNVNALSRGLSALNFAAHCGHTMVIAQMLEHPEIDLEIGHHLGKTPLRIANEGDRIEILNLLNVYRIRKVIDEFSGGVEGEWLSDL